MYNYQNYNSNYPKSPKDKKKDKEKEKYKFKNIIQNTKMIGIATLSIGAVSLQGIDYFNEKKQQLNNSTENHSTTDTYEEFQEKIVEINRNNPIKITAEKLIDKYNDADTIQENKELNKKYANKYVEVTGEVYKTYSDVFGGHYLTIHSENADKTFDDFMWLECNFPKENVNDFKQIEKGDEVTINGYCVGTEVTNVGMYDCRLKDIEK